MQASWRGYVQDESQKTGYISELLKLGREDIAGYNPDKEIRVL